MIRIWNRISRWALRIIAGFGVMHRYISRALLQPLFFPAVQRDQTPPSTRLKLPLVWTWGIAVSPVSVSRPALSSLFAAKRHPAETHTGNVCTRHFDSHAYRCRQLLGLPVLFLRETYDLGFSLCYYNCAGWNEFGCDVVTVQDKFNVTEYTTTLFLNSFFNTHKTIYVMWERCGS